MISGVWISMKLLYFVQFKSLKADLDMTVSTLCALQINPGVPWRNRVDHAQRFLSDKLR